MLVERCLKGVVVVDAPLGGFERDPPGLLDGILHVLLISG
jgi:hypothetical protein